MHEHIDLLSDKTAPKKKRIWTGLFASGEAIALFFALSICFGAVTYLLLSFEPQPIWFGGSAALMSLSLFVLWRLQPAGLIRGFLIIIIGFQLGVLAGKVRTYVAAAPTILKPMGPVMLEGWLSAVEPAKKGVRLRIKPHAISGLASEDLPKTVRLTHRLSLQVAPGRYVRCWAVMRTPPGPAIPGDYNFRRQAWFEGLGAVGYVQGRCRGGVLGNPVSGWATFNLKIASARRRLAVFVHTAAGERAGGFAAALISGDRSFMATADQDVLRSSGLAHVLAISGLHLGIVGGLVYFLFRHGLAFIAPLSVRFPIQKPAAVAALIAITAYLIVSGASVSTQRAWIMSGVFFAAILFDRPALSLRSFSLAMISVVLLRPESVLLPGFQMSFAATGILIAVYENWSRKMAGVTAGMLSKARLFFASICVTSFAAFMATAPFAIFHFERVAPFGLIANFTAMPVIALLSVPSAALALLLTPFGYADIGLRLFGYSLELILFIANLASGQSLPLRFATTHMPEVSLGFFVLALVSFLLLRRWLRALSVALFVAFGGSAWLYLAPPDVYWAPSGEVYVASPSGRTYKKIPFAASDALKPLKLRNSRETLPCQQETCKYKTASHTDVYLMQTLREKDCQDGRQDSIRLVLEKDVSFPRNKACGLVISWSEIVNKGGLSVRKTQTGFRKYWAMGCGNRPWNKC